MKKFKVKMTYNVDVEFEVDENNSETIEILKGFNESIRKNSSIKDILEYYVYNYFHNHDVFIEGIGNTEEIEDLDAIKIIESDEDFEFETEEVE